MRFLATLLIAVCSSVGAQMSNPGVVPSAALSAGDCLQATGAYSIGTTGSPCGSGSGSVTGPTESTQNGVAAFSNTTGTGIEDTGIQYSNLGLLSGTQTWTGTNTFAGVAKAVSFQSFGGGSSLSDAGISAPNVVTTTLTLNGTTFNPATYAALAAANTFTATPQTIAAGTASALKVQTTGGIAATFFANDATSSFGIFDAATGGNALAFAKGTDVGTFTSAPFITTLPAGTNNTQAASTAFVQNALGKYLPLTGGTLSGPITATGEVDINTTSGSFGLLRWNTAAAWTFSAGLDLTGNWNLWRYNPANSAVVDQPIRVNLSTGSVSLNPLPALTLSAGTGVWKPISFNTGTSQRWQIGSDNDPETGSNTGSDFRLYSYADNGAVIANNLSINRATGATAWSARPFFAGNLAWDAGNLPNPVSQNLAGSPYYIALPRLTNAQLITGVGTVLFSLVVPRAMTLVGFEVYYDTAPAAHSSFIVTKNTTSSAGGGIGSIDLPNTQNKGGFLLNNGPVSFVEGDRIYIVNLIPANSIGSMDGLSVTLMFILN